MMEPWGEFKKKVLIVGEFPTKLDDNRGAVLNDKFGKLLQNTLEKYGLDLERDCLVTSALKCHPGKLSKKLSYEVNCCRRFLMQVIDERMPKVIIALGEYAVTSLISHRWKKDFGTINKWRGWAIPDQDFKAWICPTFAPSMIYDKDEEYFTVWEQDLHQAIEHISKSFPVWKEPEIDYITDLKVLRKIEPYQNMVAIDYESTGIKPDAPGHRLVCASVADTPDHAFVFMFPPTKKERLPYLELLTNPAILKLAQNMKYEHIWSLVKLRKEIVGWAWDSMLASHIMDNREGVTGLKFQTYVQFGLVDYSSEIDPYLKSVEANNANALNRIFDLIETKEGAQKLMKYCAMDTITQYRLSLLQQERMNYSFLPF